MYSGRIHNESLRKQNDTAIFQTLVPQMFSMVSPVKGDTFDLHFLLWTDGPIDRETGPKESKGDKESSDLNSVKGSYVSKFKELMNINERHRQK